MAIDMKIRQAILIILGIFATAIGAIGIFIPILPTTPFIIAAALCFSGSSDRMYKWLSQSSYFGEFITNYQNGTGVSKKTKVTSIIFLWLLLPISMYFMRNNMLILIVLMIVGICVTAHIILLRGRNEKIPPCNRESSQ